jgi:lycopene cyclase domain-containing protein
VTYPGLALAFLLLPTFLAATAAVVARPGRSWWLVTGAVLGALLMLTALFDSLMIAADLFRFDGGRLLGVRIGRAPVEDFAWPLASVLALPSMWVLLGRRPSGPAPEQQDRERQDQEQKEERR